MIVFLYLIVLGIGCEEETKCGELSSVVYVNESSDFVYEGMFDVSGYQEGVVKIEVWDCVDASWWGPVDEQKIVQIFSNQDKCGNFVDVEQLIFECNDEDALDKFVRDEDGDGIVRVDDCDDTDETVGACDESTGGDE